MQWAAREDELARGGGKVTAGEKKKHAWASILLDTSFM
jgi:hypothetical protein